MFAGTTSANKLSLDGFGTQSTTTSSTLFTNESVIVRKTNDEVVKYTGKNNVLVGFDSGSANGLGSNNIYLGHKAGKFIANRHHNLFIGVQSGHQDLGSKNLFIGHQKYISPSLHTHSTNENNISHIYGFDPY